jgi:fibronectin type 3 domain-containing protein
MKNVAMKKTKARPKIPTIVNTKPEATLFCRKEVLEVTATTGVAVEDEDEDDWTTTVVRVTGEGVRELELLTIGGVGTPVGADEEAVAEETLLDKLALPDIQ